MVRPIDGRVRCARHRAVAASLAVALAACAAGSAGAPAQPELPRPSEPPERCLHGHNDYLQPVPLRTAIDLGFGSVEADVFLVDGELRVGHERWQLRAGRTLERLYLDPLRERVTAGGGSVHAPGRPFVLLVDVKADGEAVWRRLREVLGGFRPILTRFVDGRIEPGAVTVLLSGDRPWALLAADRDRLAALDGRLADLRREPLPPLDLMPWVSDSWRRIGGWDGKDELQPDERERLADAVRRVHEAGRELRFWGTPDRPEAWKLLRSAGVDRIGTDRPAPAAQFLRALVHEGTLSRRL
jgi:hypothetical protein